MSLIVAASRSAAAASAARPIRGQDLASAGQGVGNVEPFVQLAGDRLGPPEHGLGLGCRRHGQGEMGQRHQGAQQPEAVPVLRRRSTASV